MINAVVEKFAEIAREGNFDSIEVSGPRGFRGRDLHCFALVNVKKCDSPVFPFVLTMAAATIKVRITDLAEIMTEEQKDDLKSAMIQPGEIFYNIVPKHRINEILITYFMTK